MFVRSHIADVAQTVEQLIRNQLVVSSILTVGPVQATGQTTTTDAEFRRWRGRRGRW